MWLIMLYNNDRLLCLNPKIPKLINFCKKKACVSPPQGVTGQDVTHVTRCIRFFGIILEKFNFKTTYTSLKKYFYFSHLKKSLKIDVIKTTSYNLISSH